MLQKQFTHTFFCCKNYLCLFFCHNKIYAPFFVAKMIYAFFCRKNDLRTSSGKFLRVDSCHPESSDFLGLWRMPDRMNQLSYPTRTRPAAQYFFQYPTRPNLILKNLPVRHWIGEESGPVSTNQLRVALPLLEIGFNEHGESF